MAWAWPWDTSRLDVIESKIDRNWQLMTLLVQLEEQMMSGLTHDELLALAQKARAKVKELAGASVELAQGYEDVAAELEGILSDAQSGIDQSKVTGGSTGAGSGSQHGV